MRCLFALVATAVALHAASALAQTAPAQQVKAEAAAAYRTDHPWSVGLTLHSFEDLTYAGGSLSYAVSPRISFTGEWSGNISSSHDPDGVAVDKDFDHVLFGGGVRFYLDRGPVTPYLALGIDHFSNSQGSSESGPSAGIGVEAGIKSIGLALDLRFNMVVLGSDEPDAGGAQDDLSIGLVKRF